MKKLFLLLLAMAILLLAGCNETKENQENNNVVVESGEESQEIIVNDEEEQPVIIVDEPYDISNAVTVSEKEIVFNNTSVEGIMNEIKLDVKELELGEYKYLLGKTKVFNKDCDVYLSFNVDNIDEYGNRMYEDQKLAFVNDNKIVISFKLLGMSMIDLGNITTYKDYLIRVEEYGNDYKALTIYSKNENAKPSVQGYETSAEIKDGELIVTSYNASAGENENGMQQLAKTYYKVNEENDGIKLEEDYIDIEDVVVTSAV